MYFKVELNSSGYDIHRATWHSVVLPDNRQYGLSLVEDNDLDPFLRALDDALDVEGADDPDGPGEGYSGKLHYYLYGFIHTLLDVRKNAIKKS